MERLTSALTTPASAGSAESLVDPLLAARLYEGCDAVRWNVPFARWEAALVAAVIKHFGAAPGAAARQSFLERLRLDDLALAIACSEGNEQAWSHFLAHCHGEVIRAAVAIAGEAEGEEIADALLSDLYGPAAAGEGRKSLFAYFHGRSRLITWLRAIVAQRHVDRLRATKRLEPFEPDEQPTSAATAPPTRIDPDRDRHVAALRAAVDRALGALPPRDRLRLACYYADGLTLAAIGRLLGEHEATVSRRLQRTRDQIRREVDAVLTRDLRLTPGELRQCYEDAIEDGGLDFTRLRESRPAQDGCGPIVLSQEGNVGKTDA